MPRKKQAVSRKIPATLGEAADLLYRVRAEKSEAENVVKEINTFKRELENYIIDNLPKSNASGISGTIAKVRVYTDDVPTVDDWDKFYKYVSRKKAFELMQRRLAVVAIRERQANGEKLPGVGTFRVVKVSVTKL